jgi:large conductance mechanosensitive channel
VRLFQDFKEFAMRGNVIDMGIGVIIGTAFGKIVDSLVTDILMPPIGLLLGRVDFSNLFFNLTDRRFQSVYEAKEAGAATINYGLFVNTIIHFVIVAFATFLVIKQMNHIKKAPMESITKKECPHCYMNIPTLAKRCPSCTTHLEDLAIENKGPENTRSKLKVRIR